MNEKLLKYLVSIYNRIIRKEIEVVNISTVCETNFGFPNTDELYTSVTFRFKEKIK